MSIADPERMEKNRLESINIINALRRGTVPAGGLERIAVGLEVEEGVIGKQLDYVERGGGDLKFIRGEYGSGKTFLVARALEIARSKGFVTSHIVISPGTPLHKLRGVYQQVCSNLRTTGEEHALKAIIDTWLFNIEERILSVSGDAAGDAALEAATEREIEAALAGISSLNSALAATLRTYYRAGNAGDFTLAQAALGWISAEPNIGRELKAKAGVKGDIDDSVAFIFLQGLVSIIHGAGYSGLVIAIDSWRPPRDSSATSARRHTRSLSGSSMPLTRGRCPVVSSFSPERRRCLTGHAGSAPFPRSTTGSALPRVTISKIRASRRSFFRSSTLKSSNSLHSGSWTCMHRPIQNPTGNGSLTGSSGR